MLSKSDEEIMEDMNKNSKGYSWRRGFPSLDPHPIVTDSSSPTFLQCVNKADFDDLGRQAESVLKAQNIHGYQVMVCLRLPEHIAFTTSVDKRPYLTVLLGVDFGTYNSERIDRCIVQIHQSLLRNPSFVDIKIEAIHNACINGPPTFAIMPSDTVVLSQYEAAYDEITKQLGKKQVKWLCMETVRRGMSTTYHDCPPTIVVTTPSASDSSVYTDVLPGIRTWLFNNAFMFRIELVFGVGIFNKRPAYKPSFLINEVSYGDNVYMGASIGDDQSGTGTIGGLVTLKKTEKKFGLTITKEVRCALTNWHVVEDTRLDTGMCF